MFIVTDLVSLRIIVGCVKTQTAPLTKRKCQYYKLTIYTFNEWLILFLKKPNIVAIRVLGPSLTSEIILAFKVRKKESLTF